MSASIKLEFNENEAILLQSLKAATDCNSNFNYITLKNVTSAQFGLELILSDWFKPKICELQNVFGILLKINEQIDENACYGQRTFDFRSKTSFLVALQSNVGNLETMIYWKFPEIKGFRSICVKEDVGNKLCNFLIQELKDGRSGIIGTLPTRSKTSVHEIGNSENQMDLLAIAVNNSDDQLVCSLLSHNFIPDNVIDAAWNLFDASKSKEAENVVLALLKSDSRLPYNFEHDKSSSEIQGFINFCESLRNDIDNEDLRTLEVKLDFYPDLSCFYDRNNQSLLTYAIKTNNTAIFKKFSGRLNTGSHEDINNIYETFRNAHNLSQAHLLALKSKTRFSSTDQNACKHWNLIEETYQTINSIEYCSKIIQVVAECKNIQIFFDFKHDSTYYLDPVTVVLTEGVIWDKGIIYIGVQDLLAEKSKFKVFGVIAHEFCHLAVYLAFMNRKFDPFPTGESELKRRFKEQVIVQCKQRQNESLVPIIKDVFTNYREKHLNREIIVAYSEILLQYLEDKIKVANFEKTFEELVKYSKEVVEPELVITLDFLKKLNDESIDMNYEQLRTPIKERILSSDVQFQGVKTLVSELIGQDNQLLQTLTSEHIRNILIKNQRIHIGEELRLDMEYGIICRNFEKVVDANKNDQADNEGPSKKKRKLSKPKTELRTFDQVRDETQNSKIFLLADHAGSGKTTIFKDCARKLKEFYKNSWLSFVNLRKFDKIFEEYKEKIGGLTLDDVAEILLKIVNPKPGLEILIYIKSFKEGKAIFLFDGVDEISPIYTELLLKIFTILNKMEPKNQMWISTRPHYAKDLVNALNIPYHKFKQYKATEINKFIKQILKFHKVTDQDEYLSQIKKCMRGLKGFYYEAGESKEIENPLMVQMVAELYIDKKVDPENISRYGVYEAMIEKHKTIAEEKIPCQETNQDNSLNIWDIHRVLAIIFIIGNDYRKELKISLENLEIMQKWKEEKKKWTPDMIQRYGFVIVDLSEEKLDKTKIDFMHRTYAEFFITQVIGKFLTNDSGEIYSDSSLLNLIFTIMNYPKKFHVIHDFLLSFLNDKKLKNEEVNLERIRKVYAGELPKIHQKGLHDKFLDALKIFVKKYANIDKILFNSKTLNDLWKLEKKTNLLEEYFKSNKMEYDREITKLAEECFGSSWHDKFNKKRTNLVTDEEISKLNGKFAKNNFWNEAVNLLKFCDLLNKNFKIKDQRKFYMKTNNIYFNDSLYIEFQTEIISRAHEIFDKATFCKIFLINANLDDIHLENLNLILGIIENDYKNDEDLLKKLLLETPERSNSPLRQSSIDSDGNKKSFLVKRFYGKYKTS